MSGQRKRHSAAAVQSVGHVDHLQPLRLPKPLKVLLYLILDCRGQHLLNLSQLDEELSLVGKRLVCGDDVRNKSNVSRVCT